MIEHALGVHEETDRPNGINSVLSFHLQRYHYCITYIINYSEYY